MIRFITIVALLVSFAACFAHAQQNDGKLLEDRWYTLRTEQGKLGHWHYLKREIDRDGRKLVYTLDEDTMVTRETTNEDYVETRVSWTLETELGQVVELGYRLSLGKNQALEVRGKVDGGRITMRVHATDGAPTRFTKTAKWDKAVLGDHANDRRLASVRETSPDYEQLHFDPIMCRTSRVTCAIVGREATFVSGQRQVLLRVEKRYADKRSFDDSTQWLNDKGLAVKIHQYSQVYGTIIFELSDKARATAPFDARVSEIESPVSIDKPIRITGDGPRELVLRFKVQGVPDTAQLFPRSPRQQIIEHNKKGVTLRLLSTPEEPAAKAADAVKDEYLESNFYIRSDHPLVRRLAERAVGDAGSAIEKAGRIKTWIDDHIETTYEVNYATADEVARTREGDCTECSILGAAMCRAVGIPVRIVDGVLIEDEEFFLHQWCEIYIDGHWKPFDPTGEIQYFQAAYIKCAEYSMKDVIHPYELTGADWFWTNRIDIDVLKVD